MHEQKMTQSQGTHSGRQIEIMVYKQETESEKQQHHTITGTRKVRDNLLELFPGGLLTLWSPLFSPLRTSFVFLKLLASALPPPPLNPCGYQMGNEEAKRKVGMQENAGLMYGSLPILVYTCAHCMPIYFLTPVHICLV